MAAAAPAAATAIPSQSSGAPIDDRTLVASVRDFCRAHGVPTTGVLALTLVEHRFGSVASLVIDWEEEEDEGGGGGVILPQYPISVTAEEKALRLGGLDVWYVADLGPPQRADVAYITKHSLWHLEDVFCCRGIQRAPAGKEEEEAEDEELGARYDALLSSAGHNPYEVFEVRVHDEGKSKKEEPKEVGQPATHTEAEAAASKKHCMVLEGKIREATGSFQQHLPESPARRYRCPRHRRAFDVRLFVVAATYVTDTKLGGMHVFPYTKRAGYVLAYFLGWVHEHVRRGEAITHEGEVHDVVNVSYAELLQMQLPTME